ncbi:endolytic transglycosylase MltG [Neptuniibacter sp. CAU 1671]|uniref:endolytic transglycosylase MltG n=1 Tax=Neptuniibacter sp. CAU 1671 TaxID=3032593 RepID=UPI0023DAAFDD|nr:endolytic transglycosylase MltG [Neptuniibacter sp. CAU 1671]MDF2180495.1 endolytic transglycosylase MltG [Neptuniibacter sp. CAU 1671]
MFLGLAGFWLWQDYQDYMAHPLSIKETTDIDVSKGINFNQLLNELESKSIIKKPIYFKIHARLMGKARQIKAGYYRLEPDMNPMDLLELITSGRSISYSFTILEGSTFKQLMETVRANPQLKDDVSDLSTDALLKTLQIEAAHPEGQFLAETYHFEKNGSALALLNRAHTLLQETLDQAWETRQPDLPYGSAYEALIMASIIEKETARADERPIIAGVFVRRLNKKMRLQTDPTVIYGMGDAYTGNIRRSDLRKPTPYNTYVIPGLPPTPIAMVGREAIQAALNPADGKALFFVAKGDGSHQFSETLKQHNEAVRQFQLKRREDYRSSP